ncbi:WRKY transcription factor 25 [Populus alba x Populus x berolinensis]|uniref:WRKY transcription factor 25 n=1 Tax=Populus alba x Populus x berolinensis TaxID=444605 RepID=A0AAD6RBI8_9ROSI|nr:probable WRKY transcription factor 25 [Populus alba]KAJ6944758.1 WRKY transcription factor 25 [Populus alba x Populus x berolinensis]KAJ7005335.1 WRKY transcription factor 25 [Populus alba x Populus x berolinensis]
MSEASSTRETSMETHEEDREEQDTDHRRGQRLVLPEDGHEWKKYGQKFIKKIGKFRSYFKCRKQECVAKKRVEWSSPDNLRILYEGSHSHASSSSIQGTPSSSAANQYSLYAQVFGSDQPPSRPHHQHP